MAARFDVIEADGSRRGHKLKKCVAHLLIRRQLAILVAPFVIRRLALSEQPAELPRNFEQRHRKKFEVYQHHLEPKLEPFTLGNSPWLQFLHGYR